MMPRPFEGKERILISLPPSLIRALDVVAGPGKRSQFIEHLLRSDERIATSLTKEKAMGHVTLYEDNAGQLFLHADGGTILYQTPGEEDAAEEMSYVAENPDGDITWSAEWQFPWRDVSGMVTVAIWEDGAVTVIGAHGIAASRYLNIPGDVQGVYGTPAHLRAVAGNDE